MSFGRSTGVRSIKSRILNAALLGTVGAVMLDAAPALAQDVPAADADDSGMIVVTAQRRSELSRDVPITINTADAIQLQQANVDSLLSLPKLAPGVRIDQQGAYTQPTIRGIGTTLVQTGVGSSVGTYVDGFYLPNALSLSFDFLNVQNVQVLKGPQGTLFGRNTTGGAILVTTAEPSTETSGLVEASYERYNARKVQGYVTTGIGDTLALSLEGSYERGDGFTKDNLYDGNLTAGPGYAPGARRKNPAAYENWSVRASAKVELSDRVSFLLRFMHQDKDDPRGYMDGVYRANGVTYSAADIVPGTVFAFGRGEIAHDSASIFRLNADTLQLTGKFDLDFAELTSYTQYRKENYRQIFEGDYTSRAFLSLNLPEKDTVMSQELLLNSKPGGPLQYTAGIFLFQHEVDAGVGLGGVVPPGGQNFFAFSATGVKVRTYAGFADLTYALGDKFFITGGLRYNQDEVKSPYYQTFPGLPGVFTYQPDLKDNKLSPRVVLRYKPTDESSIYASYTKGYKSAIPDYRRTSALAGGPVYKGGYYLRPEDISAFEAGFKYGSGALSIEAAAFYYDYKNLQNGFYTQGETILSNAAKAKIKGVEGSVSYKAGGLELSANATYVDAKYKDYQKAGDFTPNFIPDNDGDGRPEFAGFAQGNADASGNAVQHAPKFSGTVSARYTLDLAGGSLVLGANLYHSSRIYFDAMNDFSQGSYDLVSARIAWTDPSDRITLAVYGDNLLDEKYFTQMQIGQAGVGTVWGEPATYGVSLRYRFGAK